jgi:hypothetical protein
MDRVLLLLPPGVTALVALGAKNLPGTGTEPRW